MLILLEEPPHGIVSAEAHRHQLGEEMFLAPQVSLSGHKQSLPVSHLRGHCGSHKGSVEILPIVVGRPFAHAYEIDCSVWILLGEFPVVPAR